MGLEKLRLGAVSYVNTLPLLGGLEQDQRVELSKAPPSFLVPKLLRGELDLALVPAAALALHPQLQPVSDCCIASFGAVDSVLLLLRQAPHLVQNLVQDPHSRSSQLLARLVLRDRYDREPREVEEDPRLAWAEGRGDAVLVIGDVALDMKHRGWPCLDLSLEWQALTGLPFVFAVWASAPRCSFDPGQAASLLEQARDRGLAGMDDCVAEASRQSSLSPAFLRLYLTRRIRYRLADFERAGLKLFLDRVQGFCPKPS